MVRVGEGESVRLCGDLSSSSPHFTSHQNSLRLDTISQDGWPPWSGYTAHYIMGQYQFVKSLTFSSSPVQKAATFCPTAR